MTQRSVCLYSGCMIFLGSLLGLVVPGLHMTGKGVGGEIAKSSGAFFFIWTIIALGNDALLHHLRERGTGHGVGTVDAAGMVGNVSLPALADLDAPRRVRLSLLAQAVDATPL